MIYLGELNLPEGVCEWERREEEIWPRPSFLRRTIVADGFSPDRLEKKLFSSFDFFYGVFHRFRQTKFAYGG
jgi:hypothetical protein